VAAVLWQGCACLFRRVVSGFSEKMSILVGVLTPDLPQARLGAEFGGIRAWRAVGRNSCWSPVLWRGVIVAVVLVVRAGLALITGPLRARAGW
jgi:hypothetical protein